MKTPRSRKPSLPRGHSVDAYDWLSLQYPNATPAMQEAVLLAWSAGYAVGHSQGEAYGRAVDRDPKTGLPHDLIASLGRPPKGVDTAAPVTHKGRWSHDLS